eukprot:845987-Pelagomonas_calceolata.AAC.2
MHVLFLTKQSKHAQDSHAPIAAVPMMISGTSTWRKRVEEHTPLVLFSEVDLVAARLLGPPPPDSMLRSRPFKLHR